MGALSTSTAPPTAAQLRARLEASGALTAQDEVILYLLRLIRLQTFALAEAGIEQPDELLNLLDDFAPEDDSNATPI